MGCGERCAGCALEKIGSGFTQVEIGVNYGNARLLVVGEASGEAEARDSLPFRPYAQSGSLLADSMRRVHIERSEVAITNVLRCFPGNVAVNATGILQGFRRHYDGELVTVTTDQGVLPGTPNHPCLTDKGWIALGELQEGDNLVRSPFSERMPSGDPDIYRNTPRA